MSGEPGPTATANYGQEPDNRVVHFVQSEESPLNSTDNREVTYENVTILQTIGDYHIEGLLGSGGMGNVFRAKNTFFGRVEALKMIHDRLDSTAARDAFIKEMRTQSGLDHPNIVKLHYAGVCRQEGKYKHRLYLVMSLEERDLGEAIKDRGAFPPDEAARIVRRLAKALAHAHSRNVIHCDLKPKNILLDSKGIPKISDFGLVKHLRTEEFDAPAEGRPFGSLYYMPPEQARGERSRANQRNDIYGLGAILYELLTGQPPYSGSKEEVLRKLKDPLELPIPPRALNPRVPAQLDAICMKCLQKHPSKRPQSATELLKEFDDYLRVPFWKRHWREVALATMTVCLGVSFWYVFPSPRAKAQSAARAGKYDEAVKGYEELLRSSFVVDRDSVQKKLDEVRDTLKQLEEQELENVRRSADEEFQKALDDRRAGRHQQELERLSKAAEKYEAVLKRAGVGNDDIAAKMARVFARRAEVFALDRRNEDYTQAIQSARIAIAGRQGEECDLAEAQLDYVEGVYEFQLARYPESRKSFEASLRRRERHKPHHEQDDEFLRDLAHSYAYLGDPQLLTEPSTQTAEASYALAKHHRSSLVAKHSGNIEFHALHARDFGNTASVAEWRGDTEAALKASKERDDYYRKFFSDLDRLPVQFLTERAGSLHRTLELKFDSPEPPRPDDLKLLDLASAEFRRLAEPVEAGAPLSVRIGLAKSDLMMARYLYLTGAAGRSPIRTNESERFQRSLDLAASRYQALEDSDLLQGRDYYDLAVVESLSATLPGREADRVRNLVLALEHLEKAVRKKYLSIKRIDRDQCLLPLRTAYPDQFEEIRKKLIRDLDAMYAKAVGVK